MHHFRITILFLSAFIFISACGVTKRGGNFSPGDSSKKHNGATEFASKDAREIETGMASWYGPNFHGKLTANGETYDMDGITAAHRTLPFGTVVLVENLDNGRIVEVRVNDRGPFAKDRIIDLSKGAAEIVDMIGPGTANVRLYLLKGDLDNSRVTDLKIANYTVQLGSYKNNDQARQQASKIKGSRVENIQSKNQSVYRVYYGIYQDPEEARKELEKLQKQGHTGFVKQVEND